MSVKEAASKAFVTPPYGIFKGTPLHFKITGNIKIQTCFEIWNGNVCYVTLENIIGASVLNKIHGLLKGLQNLI